MKKIFLLFVSLLPLCHINIFAQNQVVIELSKDSSLVLNVWDVQRMYFQEDPNPLTFTVPEAVDLCLPSGLKWASVNLKADGTNGLFGWGDITGKNTSTDLVYFPIKVAPKDIVKSDYDIVFKNLQSEWRLPSKEDWEELLANTDKSYDATTGCVTLMSKLNQASITLPLAGYRVKENVSEKDVAGYYWTGNLSQEADSAYAYKLSIGEENAVNVSCDSLVRYKGASIRPVYGIYEKQVSLTTSIENVTNSTATLMVTFEGDVSSYTTFDVVYATDESFTYPTKISNTMPDSEAASVTLTGLDYNTVYYIYAQLTSADGIVTRSQTVTAQTNKKYSVQFVDLGLKSGLKWANVNLGAENNDSTEYGNYFAWADPNEKSTYQGDYEFKVEASPADIAGTEWDVVTKVLGADAHLPNQYDFLELQESCTWEYVGSPVAGCMVTGQNGNRIFMPFAGNRQADGSKYREGYIAFYWTSNNRPDNAGISDANALYYSFNSSKVGKVSNAAKYMGMSIRAVSGKSNTTDPTSSGGEKPVDPETPSDYDAAAVDLGLSVYWASYNLGATKAGELGDSYEWGDSIKYSDNRVFDLPQDLPADISNTEYDVVHNTWGGAWRMPTEIEFNELMEYCTWTWNSVDKVYTVAASNGNSITFPVTDEEVAYYWTSNQYLSNNQNYYRNGAYYLGFYDGKIPESCSYGYYYIPAYIRPVKTK